MASLLTTPIVVQPDLRVGYTALQASPVSLLCGRTSLLDLTSPCIRATWSAIIPVFLVICFCISFIPLSQPLQRAKDFVASPFQKFMSMTEAEQYIYGEEGDAEEGVEAKGHFEEHAKYLEKERKEGVWVMLVLSWLALVEAIAWMGVGSYQLAALDSSSSDGTPDTALWKASTAALIALTWVYASVRPTISPQRTPPYDLFALYFVHLVLAAIRLGGELYDWNLLGEPFPTHIELAAKIADIVVIGLLLIVILGMPVGVPSAWVNREEIGKSVSPEDYTSLWGWISFTWVKPLIARGTYTTLNEKDVWSLSPSLQARPNFLKFDATKRSSLLRRIWAVNSLDLILDFMLTFISVIFNYASPFFLKQILDSLAPDATPAQRSQAYILALLAFLSQCLKSQADVQHLWFGRRAATRMKTELMSAIYHKALLRKDFSGIVMKDGKESAEKKVDDPKSGADIGKIVNLMAGDANRVGNIISGLYFIYGAPFELIIASVFLYQLLGPAAFAGFLVILVGWPLNSFLARRSVRIQKSLLAARDKRMSVLSELLGAVKFIKFFAWEERWITRTSDAREVELGWLVKSRINSIFFQSLWVSASVFVSLISFWVFVMQGKVLTVGIAFTAIQLFGMLRTPLNVIPSWIVQILQTRVALKRIENFLEEDEVTEQVSSIKSARLKRDLQARGEEAPFSESLGLKEATLRWNSVQEKEKDTPKKEEGKKGKDKKDDGKTKQKGVPDAAPSSDISESVSITVEAATPEEGEQADEEMRFELTDISVVFPDGELTVITGPTASGKSALLMALLGELTLQRGEILMSKDPSRVDPVTQYSHTISYAAQSPWLQHQSIRDNILFGSKFDEARYWEVVKCCALEPDLEILEDGDLTEIGARGVSLSGGQKARVALARAVYVKSKFVLLDDPLSAVDSHTARFLYEKLFLGPLMKNRTVLLVTHHVELVLPGAYYIVRMESGRIETQGTIKELRQRGILEAITSEAEAQAAEEQAAKDEKEAEDEAEKIADEVVGDTQQTSSMSGNTKGITKGINAKKPRKLIEEEERQTGSVKWNIYKTYLKASSYWTWGILATLVIMTQLLGVTEKYWIMIWGEAYNHKNQFSPFILLGLYSPTHASYDGDVHLHSPQHAFQLRNFSSTLPSNSSPIHSTDIRDKLPNVYDHPLFYVGVYAVIGLSIVFINVLSAAVQYLGALRASRTLFSKLLGTTVRATMRWHDTTPQGRMLNRFSKDIETVDSSLASSLQNVNSCLANFFSSALVVVVIFPLFVLPATIIGYFYYVLAIGYLHTGRDLRRMESTTRSPIFSGFGELLDGIVTVRAFSAERRFMSGLYKKIDLTTKMWYTFWMTNRYLLLHFDVVGASAVFITTMFALSGYVSAGMAGFCITSAMTFTNNVYWACRFWTTLELDLNSVERVVEYLDLPQEPAAVIEGSRPPAAWPSSTNTEEMVVIEDLEVKYSPELPSVLHGVSFVLKPRERVGLLGRTGSGKSTLAMSLLRFVDPTGGRILVDGVDITKIGVHDLRSRITFIPQDATLFSGTLRDNLDPFNDYSDSECLDALYRVQMLTEESYTSQKSSRVPSRAPSIHGSDAAESSTRASTPTTATFLDSPSNDLTKAPITLKTKVTAGGLNFSQGQRQLIAMARALLRQSSIIVLDEATSSIDFETDAKIQKTIREEFGSSLLLTVAHRLRTVIDYDRLVVLDKGRLAEIDTPYNLIRKEGGIFRSMCLKSGTFGELEEAAKAKHDTVNRLA